MSRSKVKGQRSKVKVTGTKKRKTAESCPLTMHSRACAVGRTQQAAADDTTAWPPMGDGLRGCENQRVLSSVSTDTDGPGFGIHQIGSAR